MQKILFITYHFPPIAGSGIQRSLKFIKYLPEFGIEPIVLTPQNAQWQAYDVQNLKLPYLKKRRIYRRGIKRLTRYYELRFNRGHTKHPYFYILALKYLWFMDLFSSWYFECNQAALKIASKEQVAGIFTTSPPHSTHLFGHFLKTQLNLPWVMDIRDSMYDDPNISHTGFMGRFNQKIELFYEKKFYPSASAITTVSQPIADSIGRRHPGQGLNQKTHVITNGFDPEDFPIVDSKDLKNDRMTITYTGSFMAKQTPEHFLKAVKHLVDQDLIDTRNLLFRFMGHFNRPSLELLQQFQKWLPIEIMDFQPYDRVIHYQTNSDALLLIVSMTAEEGGTHTFTGKFFEYLGARRPIFALAPEGPLKKTIEDGRFGVVVQPTNISDIADKFKVLYDHWQDDQNLPYNGDLILRSHFERKKLAERLAQIINECIS